MTSWHHIKKYRWNDTIKVSSCAVTCHTQQICNKKEDHAKLAQYVEATQSLKAGGSRKGEFTVGRYDNTIDTVEFTKVALGKGKWGYKDSKGDIHGSISDLITESTAVAVILDSRMKKLHEALSLEQELVARGKGDPAKAALLEEQLTNLVHANRITRKLNPITGKPMTTEDKEKYIDKKEPVENQ